MSDAKQIIPPGWKLVPIAPTKEMVEAGETALDEAKDSSWDSGGDGESCHSYEYLIPGAQTNIYKAMLEPISIGLERERGGGVVDIFPEMEMIDGAALFGRSA
jgi:hypothetical protein